MKKDKFNLHQMKACIYKNKLGIVKKKSDFVSYYNKLKSRVDLANMGISIYHTKRKTKK